MNKIRDLARNVLNDMNVGIHLDIVCEQCDDFEDVFILKLVDENNMAIFDIIDERLKMVSLSRFEGFDEPFVRQFQNLMIDELYAY